MSRHTLPDGQTPDPAIPVTSLDGHWVELAPPAKLVGAYYRSELRWHEFEQRYLAYLQSSGPANKRMAQLIGLALVENVTVLCVEESATHCHRRLLAEECKRRNPSVEIRIA
ncbi:MAG: DUF488 domain-containing protein [Patescibacteria group bacterium]